MARQQRARVASLVAVVATAMGLAWGQAPALYDSFEDGVPASWAPARAGTLQISDRHAKHGTHCLRWDWQAGDTIRVGQTLGNIGRTGGYGGSYSKATFGLWVYCEQPVAGKLLIQFRTGEKVGGWFEFPLDFTGWRRAHLKYSFGNDFQGRVAPETDNILLAAPATVPRGTVFMDLVVYNGVLDYRQQHVPSAKPWQPDVPDPAKFPLPATVTPEELAGIATLGKNVDAMVRGGGTVTEATVASLEKEMAQWQIVRDAQGIQGVPVVHSRQLEFYADVPGVVPCGKLATFMLRLARAYHGTADPALRRRLGDAYGLLAEHLRDQGMTAGSGFSWNWYEGRELADANYLMREPLRERGLLDWASAYLDYNYRSGDIFDDSTIAPNMDYFGNDLRPKLCGALMQSTPAEQVRWLRAFTRRLNLDILNEQGNGFKPDGSTFHHGMHYFAYASYCVNALVSTVAALSDTPFRLSPAATARLKQVVLAMRFYCNERDLPLSLSGRHPFSQSLNPGTLLTLARAAGTEGKLDPELAAAYLRFDPAKADTEPFKAQGLKPEPPPQGNMTMPYAGLMAHRRGDWLATVKGYGRYVAFGEIYATDNRFGRYLSNGYLDILGGGQPISRAGSGCTPEGWDWSRLDGTTTIHLPLDKLVAVSSGTEGIGSDQAFVGGLSHRGRQGLFVMQLQGGQRHEPTFRGRKTTFLCDDRILCLGSDIVNADATHETETTLFQKHLPDTAAPLWVNGQSLTAFPAEQTLPGDRANWLIDPQGTGYFLPAGQQVHVVRQHQRSRDQANRQDNEGDFAVAWIGHGAAPTAGTYEYAVLVRATPERMAQFAAAMQTPERPYEVVQKDAQAHIVRDRATGLWGFVLFAAGELRPGLPLRGVDRPLLVMFEPAGADGLAHLSVADPDLNLQDGLSQPRPVRVTLAGAFGLDTPGPDCRVVEQSGGQTVIEVTCREGRSHDLPLRPL